jgi:hypothetical protein
VTAAAANGQPPPDGRETGAELRLLIREVLADALPDLRDRLAAGHGAPASSYAPPPAVPPYAPSGQPPVAPPTAIPAGIVADGDTQPPRSAGTSSPSMLMGGLVFTGEHQTAHQPHSAGAAAPDGARAPARHVVTRAAASSQATPAASGRGAAVRAVRLETDEDVRQFALDIVRLADNPARRADLIAGRLTFTLAGSPATAARRPEHRVDAGAVTERAVQAAAKAGERLVLGPRAMLTPLARDRALALGVPIEKER